MAYSQDLASYGRDSANKTSKMVPVDSSTLIAGANIDVSHQVGVEGEVGISVNPLNPLNIVATSNNNADLSRMATYFSTDGGTTWTTVFIDETQDGQGANDTRFDPNVAFDSDGNVYVVYSLNTDTTSHLMLAKSADGGNTYAQVTEVTTDPANNNLHTAMVTTRADPKGADDVLVLWARVVSDENIQAALSLDGGATFPTINNNINDASQRTFLPWAVVDDTGDFHVAWEVNLAGTSPDGRIFHDVLDGATLADGTDVTVTDIQITDQFQATSKLPAQPDRGVWSTVTIDADRSGGSNDGRMYISYTDRASTATDDTNIFVRFSDDGGSSWSSAIQINDDGGTTSQFLPRLALDQTTGDVYAAWYDARNDAADNQLVDIFTAVSVNGGTSWGPNEQLTTAQSDESTNNPLRDPNNYTEYMGLAAFGGAAFVSWTDARADNFNTGNNEEIFFGRALRAGEIADKHDDSDKVVKGRRGDDILTGNDGADGFTFRDNQTGENMITDFDRLEDVVKPVGFGASFDPLAAVSATSRGTELDLGGGDSVLLLGRTVAEFSADHFLIL